MRHQSVEKSQVPSETVDAEIVQGDPHAEDRLGPIVRSPHK